MTGPSALPQPGYDAWRTGKISLDISKAPEASTSADIVSLFATIPLPFSGSSPWKPITQPVIDISGTSYWLLVSGESLVIASVLSTQSLGVVRRIDGTHTINKWSSGSYKAFLALAGDSSSPTPTILSLWEESSPIPGQDRITGAAALFVGSVDTVNAFSFPIKSGVNKHFEPSMNPSGQYIYTIAGDQLSAEPCVLQISVLGPTLSSKCVPLSVASPPTEASLSLAMDPDQPIHLTLNSSAYLKTYSNLPIPLLFPSTPLPSSDTRLRAVSPNSVVGISFTTGTVVRYDTAISPWRTMWTSTSIVNSVPAGLDADNKIIYLCTGLKSNEKGSTGHVVALDLSSGNSIWDGSVAGASSAVLCSADSLTILKDGRLLGFTSADSRTLAQFALSRLPNGALSAQKLWESRVAPSSVSPADPTVAVWQDASGRGVIIAGGVLLNYSKPPTGSSTRPSNAPPVTPTSPTGDGNNNNNNNPRPTQPPILSSSITSPEFTASLSAIPSTTSSTLSTTSPTPEPPLSSSGTSSDGLGTVAKVMIPVACVLAAFLVGFFVFRSLKRRRQQSGAKKPENNNEGLDVENVRENPRRAPLDILTDGNVVSVPVLLSSTSHQQQNIQKPPSTVLEHPTPAPAFGYTSHSSNSHREPSIYEDALQVEQLHPLSTSHTNVYNTQPPPTAVHMAQSPSSYSLETPQTAFLPALSSDSLGWPEKPETDIKTSMSAASLHGSQLSSGSTGAKTLGAAVGVGGVGIVVAGAGVGMSRTSVSEMSTAASPVETRTVMSGQSDGGHSLPSSPNENSLILGDLPTRGGEEEKEQVAEESAKNLLFARDSLYTTISTHEDEPLYAAKTDKPLQQVEEQREVHPEPVSLLSSSRAFSQASTIKMQPRKMSAPASSLDLSQASARSMSMASSLVNFTDDDDDDENERQQNAPTTVRRANSVLSSTSSNAESANSIMSMDGGYAASVDSAGTTKAHRPRSYVSPINSRPLSGGPLEGDHDSLGRSWSPASVGGGTAELRTLSPPPGPVSDLARQAAVNRLSVQSGSSNSDAAGGDRQSWWGLTPRGSQVAPPEPIGGSSVSGLGMGDHFGRNVSDEEEEVVAKPRPTRGGMSMKRTSTAPPMSTTSQTSTSPLPPLPPPTEFHPSPTLRPTQTATSHPLDSNRRSQASSQNPPSVTTNQKRPTPINPYHSDTPYTYSSSPTSPTLDRTRRHRMSMGSADVLSVHSTNSSGGNSTKPRQQQQQQSRFFHEPPRRRPSSSIHSHAEDPGFTTAPESIRSLTSSTKTKTDVSDTGSTKSTTHHHTQHPSQSRRGRRGRSQQDLSSSSREPSISRRAPPHSNGSQQGPNTQRSMASLRTLPSDTDGGYMTAVSTRSGETFKTTQTTGTTGGEEGFRTVSEGEGSYVTAGEGSDDDEVGVRGVGESEEDGFESTRRRATSIMKLSPSLLAAVVAITTNAVSAALYEPSDGKFMIGSWLDSESTATNPDGGNSPTLFNTNLGNMAAAFQLEQEIPVLKDQFGTQLTANNKLFCADAIMIVTVRPRLGFTGYTPTDVSALADQLNALTSPTGSSRRVILRFAPEMNGNWNENYGQRPTAFKKAYVEIVNAIRAKTNRVSFMWSPNAGNNYPFGAPLTGYELAALDTNGDGRLDNNDDPYTPYWPGAEYVDWIGVSLYWKGFIADGFPQTQNKLAPSDFMEQMIIGGPEGSNPRFKLYDFCTTYNKPMLMAEGGSAFHESLNNQPLPPGPGRLAVLRSFWSTFLNPTFLDKYPKLKMFVFFEYVKRNEDAQGIDNDYRISVYPEVVQAFRGDLGALGGRVVWAGKYVPGYDPLKIGGGSTPVGATADGGSGGAGGSTTGGAGGAAGGAAAGGNGEDD
ncbi:hypothetical protein HDV05_005359 [Chytridiales sp. JEL 0842]|nr:hypothetical protein HDV05_005359 [Chytridiales sp. JEL 0842]